MKKVTLLNMKEQKMLMIFFYSDIFRIIFHSGYINKHENVYKITHNPCLLIRY